MINLANNRLGMIVRYEQKKLIDNKTWFDQEAERTVFQDRRLGKHFRTLLEQHWKGVGQSIPFCLPGAELRLKKFLLG